MFPTLNDTRKKIDSIRKIIEMSVQIRALLTGSQKSQLSKITIHSSAINDWPLYDQCAVLVRLYAIYEVFVEELISKLLFLLPTLYSYADLGDGFHTEHRNGMAQLLQRLDMEQYKELSEQEVLQDYLDALSGVQEYNILPETMLRYDQNLRLNILDLLFSRVSISGVHSWLHHHRLIKKFMSDVRDEQNAVDSKLALFIQYRNQAAHGKVEDLLATQALLEYCDFVDLLCQALNERVNHWIISRQLEIGTAEQIGIVTERYRQRIFVAKIRNATVTLGDRLFFLGSRYCYPTRVESIQVEGASQTTVTVSDEQEIGFQATVQGIKKARVVRTKRVAAK